MSEARDINERAPSEEQVQRIAELAVKTFGGTVGVIATDLATDVVFRTSRFGRLQSVDRVVPEDSIEQNRDALEEFVAAIASGSFRKGFDAALKQESETDPSDVEDIARPWSEGVTPGSGVDRIKAVTLFRHGSPDLISVGWERFTVSQMEAFSSLLRLATAAGIEYERLTNKLGREPTAEEASSHFGLELSQEFQVPSSVAEEEIS